MNEIKLQNNRIPASRKEDKRVRFTKIFLKEALLRLMKEKPFSQITTTELCREADINRNTFYTHFATVQEILELIETELKDYILSSLSFDKGMKGIISEIVKKTEEKSNILSVILSPNGDFGFGKKLFEIIQEKSIREMAKKRQDIRIRVSDLNYIFSFFFVGSSAIIECWFTDGMKKSAEEVSDLIYNLIQNGISHYIK